MSRIPDCVASIFRQWSQLFSESVWSKFQTLIFAAIVCSGRHTINRLLRVAGELADGHWSSYHRVISKRRWSTWKLAYVLTEHLLARWGN